MKAFLIFLSAITAAVFRVHAQRIDFDRLKKEVQEAENSREKALALIAYGSAFSPSEYAQILNYSDSILYYAEASDSLFYQAASTYLKGIGYYRKGDLQLAKQYFYDYQVLNGDENQGLYFKSQNFIGIIYMRTRKPDSAVYLYENLIARMDTSYDKRSYLSAYGNLGKAYQKTGDFTKAIEYFEKCVAVDSLNQFSILNSYLSISGIYADMKMPDKTLETLKGVDLSNVPEQPIVAAYQNDIGMAFYELDQPDSAIGRLRKGYGVNKRLSRLRYNLKSHFLLARLYMDQATLSGVDTLLKEAGTVLKSYPNPEALIDYHKTSALYMLSTERPDSSIFHAKEAIKIANSNPRLKAQTGNSYKIISDAYQLLDNKEQAISFLELHSTHLDSLKSDQANEFFAKARARYLLDLREKEAEESKSKLQYSNQRQLWLSILLITMCGVLGYLYVRFKRSRKKLDDQQALNQELDKEIKKQKTEIIELKSKAVLPIEDIVSIKSDGHYLEFYLKNKERPEIDRNRIKQVLEVLPPTKFIQIHKSYIVNIEQIKVKFATKVILQNGTELPVSRTYKTILEKAMGADEPDE